MSSVLPSGLFAVLTAWPATKSGKFARPGLRLSKTAPGAAPGVMATPVGRTSALGIARLCCAWATGAHSSRTRMNQRPIEFIVFLTERMRPEALQTQETDKRQRSALEMSLPVSASRRRAGSRRSCSSSLRAADGRRPNPPYLRRPRPRAAGLAEYIALRRRGPQSLCRRY